MEVFTVKEAAAFLKVTPETVRRLCRRGKIPFARIGGHIRLLQSDIEALFRPQESKTMSREESFRLLGIDLSLP